MRRKLLGKAISSFFSNSINQPYEILMNFHAMNVHIAKNRRTRITVKTTLAVETLSSMKSNIPPPSKNKNDAIGN